MQNSRDVLYILNVLLIFFLQILLDRNTITGHIYFEGSVRKGSQFEIIELQPTGLIKVGTWQEHKNFTFKRPMLMKPIADNTDNSMINKTLRVLIAVPVSCTNFASNIIINVNFSIRTNPTPA